MIGTIAARNLRHQGPLLLAMTMGLITFEVAVVYAAGSIEAGPGLRPLLSLVSGAFGGALDPFLRFISFPAAVAFGFQHPVVLAIGIAWVCLAATVPAAERESGFLDLVLARPVPRWRYLAANLAGVVLGSLLAPAALLAGCAAGLGIVRGPDELPWTRYVPCAFGLATILLAIGGAALLLASGAKRRGPAITRTVGATLALYVVDFLAEIRPGLHWIRWLSPFDYFRPVPAAVVPETPWVDPAVLLGVFVVAVSIAFVRFQRRDL